MEKIDHRGSRCYGTFIDKTNKNQYKVDFYSWYTLMDQC